MQGIFYFKRIDNFFLKNFPQNPFLGFMFYRLIHNQFISIIFTQLKPTHKKIGY